MPKERCFAGLDIGGQGISGLLLDGEGRVRCRADRATPAREGAEAVLGAIGSVMGELCSEGQPEVVGVGTPGGVDTHGVVVGMSANIAGWYGTRLADRISAMAGGAPCVVRNDGSIAAYAEWTARQGRSKALLFLGLGTGIGGGYIEEGRIFSGCDDRAVELGHVVIEPGGRLCVCGIRGCAEAYASGPSIGRIAVDLSSGRDAGLGSILAESGTVPDFSGSRLARVARDRGMIDARALYEAFQSGDRLAVFVDEVVIVALSRTTAAGMAFLAPDLVVFGGGVLGGARHLPMRVAEKVRSLIYADGWRHCGFENALLSDEAGLLGAAWYGASGRVDRETLFAMARRALREGSDLVR